MSTGPGRHSRWRRVLFWVAGAGLLVAALLAAAAPLAESRIRKELEMSAIRACAQVDDTSPPMIDVDLFSRSVRVTGLVLIPAPECPRASIHLSGRADTLDVTGISISGLLFDRTISVQGLVFRSSDLQLVMVADSLVDEKRSGPGEDTKEPWSFGIGSFLVGLSSVRYITAAGDTMSTGGTGIRASGKEFRWEAGTDDPTRSIQHFQLDSDELSGTFAQGYAWAVERFVMEHGQGKIDVYGVEVGPVVTLEEHSAGLKYETDVIQARIDTLQITGLDLGTGISEGIWSARRIMIGPGEITVLRDKILKNGPSVERPLLTRLIRQLPPGSGVDSIRTDGLDVTYHERVDMARGFSDIPFADIQATITGVRNVPTAFVIQASCVAFEAAPVSMILISRVQDTTDHFELDASIGRMPFNALNRATGPLLDIRSTEGRIDSVILHMDADDRHATGSVYMNYHGLQLSSGGKERKEAMNRLETILLNTLVQNDHMNSKGGYREGSFSFPRRQDRAVFNYMWSGLREGTKAVLLPGMLTQ